MNPFRTSLDHFPGNARNVSDTGIRGPNPPIFRREERHELRYQLSIGSAILLSWIAWLLPNIIRMRAADAFGVIFYRLSSTYSANVERNVRQVLGPETTDMQVVACVKSIFRTSARNFVDLIVTPRHPTSFFKDTLQIVEGDISIVHEAQAHGNGVIFITGHVGCFDFTGQALLAHGFPLTIVTGRTTSRFIFDGVTHLRRSHGNILVEPTPSGVRHAYRALRRNECTVFVVDRDFFQNGRSGPFFGKITTLPPGAVRIARDTGAMVVPIISQRSQKGHALQILEPFTVAKTADVEGDLDDGMRKIVAALEYGIREHVDQWAMFQNVWPEQAPATIRVFPVGSPLESELLERVVAVLPERKPSVRKHHATSLFSPFARFRRKFVKKH